VEIAIPFTVGTIWLLVAFQGDLQPGLSVWARLLWPLLMVISICKRFVRQAKGLMHVLLPRHRTTYVDVEADKVG
jgi:hypothetical protein